MATLEERSELARRLEQGWTLPASWYTDPGTVSLEHERIFARTWQYAGRAEQVAEPGDYFTGRAGHIPVVLVRDDEGALRGFVNVCRHRAHEVASGAGNRKTLQCPYHAWTYGLDGCLRTVPRSEGDAGFPKDELSLVPVQVDTWGPLAFVNPDLAAGPLSEVLGELPATVAGGGLEVDTLVFHERREWRIGSNWKVAIENYLECYHCPVAHPGFSALLDVDESAYRIEAHEWYSSQFGPVRPPALAGEIPEVAFDPRGAIAEAQYHLVWPNLTINIAPGPPNLDVDVWMPDGAGGTVGFSDRWFGPDVPDELKQEIIAFDLQVGAEDDALVESVQRGLESGMVSQGRLLLPSEKLIHHFQRLVLDALA